jgi:ribosomal protein S12 methylthiotransferase accessory factor
MCFDSPIARTAGESTRRCVSVANVQVSVVPDILALQDRLVSPFCGIIRKLHRVHKDVLEPAVPYIWRAEIANHRFASARDEKVIVASGKGLTQAAAMRSALGESVERYCALRVPGERSRIARRTDLIGASLDPARLVLHSPEQLETLPYHHYSQDTALAWVEGEDLTSGARIWLPAQAVYLVTPTDSPTLFQTTSNGLAAGQTPAHAKLAAVLEVVERDAFLTAWYHRLPVRRLNWARHPDPDIVGIGRAYLHRDVAIELYLLPSDHEIPVVAALAIEEGDDGVAAVVGLGAHRSLARAAASAMMEVGQVRPALRMKLRDAKVRNRRDELVGDPSLVSELEDHDLLYTDRRMLGAFSTWRSSALPTVTDFTDDHEEPAADLAWVLARLNGVGSQVQVCDVSTPDIAALHLHVFRAIVDDFQPIHFGEAEFRRGGSRFYEMPKRLGLADGRVAYANLNPLPHPLS